MKTIQSEAGIRKWILYIRISLHVAIYYAARIRELKWSVADYLVFLRRATLLLLNFRHNKAVRVSTGYKIDLYVPAYPSKAFFHILDSKLVMNPPGPTTVVFSITKACRYKCVHCYQRRDRGKDMEEKLMADTAKQMQESGVAFFNIEGGEPLIQFNRLESLLRAIDDRAEVWVNTTGDGLTPEIINRLKSLRMLGVMVSIHSADPDTHDNFTGIPGSFKKAAASLKMFKSHGFATAVNSVLAEKELLEGGLAGLMNLARELGCDYVQLIHPKPAGIWMNHTEQMQNDLKIIRHLEKEHLRYNSSRKKDYPCLSVQVFEESEKVLGCTSGAVDRFYINANGEVQPCEFLNISFGNVNKEPFDKILGRMRSYFRIPCCDWLCCSQSPAIYELIRKYDIKDTPLPWKYTEELVKNWNRGNPTPVYQRLGIYK
ncbi:MAG: radical SAM protein [Victivallales bacterium]